MLADYNFLSSFCHCSIERKQWPIAVDRKVVGEKVDATTSKGLSCHGFLSQDVREI